MPDDAPGPPPRLLFGKITPGNADATINRLALFWAAIVAVQLLGIAEKFDVSSLPWIVISFYVWSAAGAYFVWSRKSRAVAFAQLAYVILLATTALFPLVRDGSRLSRALGLSQVIFMAWIGWRALCATWVHHRAANSRIEWRCVVAVSGLMVVAIPCVAFAALAGLPLIDRDADPLTERHAVEAAFAVLPLIMALLTRKYHFAKADVSKVIPRIFE